jgi:acyl-CoA synthetase (NDP forming)
MAVTRDFHGTFPRILERLLQDPQVDAVLCIYCSYRLPKYSLYDSSEHIAGIAARYREKPVLCWSYGLDIEGFTKKVEDGGAAMVFPSLDGAAVTLAKLAEYGQRRSRAGPPAGQPAPDDPAKSFADRVLAKAIERNLTYLFTEGLEILQAYGLKLAPWRLSATKRNSRRTSPLFASRCALRWSPPRLFTNPTAAA